MENDVVEIFQELSLYAEKVDKKLLDFDILIENNADWIMEYLQDILPKGLGSSDKDLYSKLELLRWSFHIWIQENISMMNCSEIEQYKSHLESLDLILKFFKMERSGNNLENHRNNLLYMCISFFQDTSFPPGLDSWLQKKSYNR